MLSHLNLKTITVALFVTLLADSSYSSPNESEKNNTGTQKSVSLIQRDSSNDPALKDVKNKIQTGQTYKKEEEPQSRKAVIKSTIPTSTANESLVIEETSATENSGGSKTTKLDLSERENLIKALEDPSFAKGNAVSNDATGTQQKPKNPLREKLAEHIASLSDEDIEKARENALDRIEQDANLKNLSDKEKNSLRDDSNRFYDTLLSLSANERKDYIRSFK